MASDRIDDLFDGMTEEEITEIMEGSMDRLLEIIKNEDRAPSVININEYKRMDLIYSLVKREVSGTDVETSYALHKPFKCTGSITVKGKSILFANPKMVFPLIEKGASCLEFNPKTTGEVEFNISFNDLTTAI